ncbi:Putative peptidoglycan binding domain-containing protein [Carboxydocella sporoproducens DSM 16521]|uniref:Peptidoglycan binding domain-containing protein n=2 Tax=Carboxydocella TaxID=178898 RepID=A0A2R4N0L4_CARTR|nr:MULTISPECIES: peptidoglycan-binding protein [Carboxydocella]AVX20559.1 Putative peptidoglycan binding domain-containing protein [Carboxydocella thermautotrophica]SJZ56804.1 Putative peptidoglycan binding domain-containing protein [Carboxydocella sporoproducens DSM 16521]
MRKLAIYVLCIILFHSMFIPSALGATKYLQNGDKGPLVKELQVLLKQKKVYNGPINGIFDNRTHAAVVKWQKRMGLPAYGKVGPATWATLKKQNESRTKTVSRSGDLRKPGYGQLIDWSLVNQLWEVGTIAQIIDLETGKQFNVKRIYGHNHADVIPLTAADTEVLRSLYGRWSWDRRAVIVCYNGQYWAASINGMPHGEGAPAINNFPGHFCVHFLNSRTHGSSYTKSGVSITDPDHQRMVRKAAGL